MGLSRSPATWTSEGSPASRLLPWGSAKQFCPALELFLHLRGAGHAGAAAAGHGAVEIEDRGPVVLVAGVKLFDLGGGQFVERELEGLGEFDDRADRVVGLAEGHAVIDEVVGEIGGE